MRFSVAPVFVLAGLASKSFANVFITNPVASTVVQAGEPFLIQWELNSDSPADLGPADVGLYVGTVNVQAQVAQLATSVPTANVTSVNVTIPATSGENSAAYFIRFTSNSITASPTSQAGAEVFSARFTVTNMTGKFSPAELAAINAETASLSSSAGSSTSPPSFAAATNSPSSKAASTPSSSGSSGSSASTASTTSKPSQTAASSALSTGINMVLFGAFVFGSTGLLL